MQSSAFGLDLEEVDKWLFNQELSADYKKEISKDLLEISFVSEMLLDISG
jgi:hypothetical protein